MNISKNNFLPDKNIDVNKIINKMLEREVFRTRNEALRRRFQLRQKVNNNRMQYDRLYNYIDENITPALKSKYTKDLFKLNKSIDKDMFHLHFLNNSINLTTPQNII